MSFVPGHTLEAARIELFNNVRDGVKCPCCDQFAKQYKRPFYSAQALNLIRIYKCRAGMKLDPWIHLQSRLPVRGGDYAKLRYWGLIESKNEEGDDTKSSGMWRITKKGIAFVRREITIDRYVMTYNNELSGFGGGQIGIEEALGVRYNYEAVMAGFARPRPEQAALF